jgi:hypothetical protein
MAREEDCPRLAVLQRTNQAHQQRASGHVNKRISAAALSIAIIAASCASNEREAPIAAPVPVETVTPTTTNSEDDREREAELERQADMEQLEAIAVNCPESHSDMVRYYDDSGEIMDCAQFGEFMVAVAVAMEQEAERKREAEFAAAVRAEMRAQAQRDREYIDAIKAELAEQAEAEARLQRQREYEEAVKRAIREQTATAQQIGDSLLRSQCHGNGGTYEYWISPSPGARVTSCYQPRPTNNTSSVRTGAVCRDGWRSSATGRGACSHHGGVAYWTY